MLKDFNICLMGPTAAGKTQLAVQLREVFPFEMISVDSAMVYRGMNIGTAKPDVDFLAKNPHRLIDICDPNNSYSAALFREDALREIEAVRSINRIPLLVGGTMLYFHALTAGLAQLPSADMNIRIAIEKEASEIGWPMLHERLKKIDPPSAARIHPHDRQRIQRALEVFMISHKTLSDWFATTKQTTSVSPVMFQQLIIAPNNRAILHERIAMRFKNMLAAGLVEEVEELKLQYPLTADLPSMRSVGYRQVWDYLVGKLTWDEMQEKAIISTRQLAKRQLTWLKSLTNAVWFDCESKTLTAEVIQYLKTLDLSS